MTERFLWCWLTCIVLDKGLLDGLLVSQSLEVLLNAVFGH